MKKVYYNQADVRWANHPYPSKTLPNATIKSGGCGVTCAAMVVSSSKETIKPDKMGDISRANGYRASGGTAWGLFSYIAKKWNFKTKTVKTSYEALQVCKEGYFVVILCGNGLWSTGGHYILAVGAKDNKIEIYDPYLYNGKFNRYDRKGKVELKGNSCWVQIDIFKKYSNARNFFAYKIEEPEVKKKSITEIAKEVIDGKWGTGEERKKKLEKARYNYNDVQKKVNELLVKPKVNYYKACSSKYNSLVDALASIGVDSSFDYRKKIAAKNKVFNYSGTATQNKQLLDKLKAGKLIKV